MLANKFAVDASDSILSDITAAMINYLASMKFKPQHVKTKYLQSSPRLFTANPAIQEQDLVVLK